MTIALACRLLQRNIGRDRAFAFCREMWYDWPVEKRRERMTARHNEKDGTPAHAISIWFHPNQPNTIWCAAEGETLQFPANDPARLVAFLRERGLRASRAGGVLRDPAREAWARAWAEDNRRKMAEVRAEYEAREERDKKRRLAKDARQMKRKEAEKLLALLGL